MTKHGTCVSTLEHQCLANDDQDVYSYFSKTLELHAKYDLHKALAAKDILSRSTPNAEDMHAAIVEAFKVDAQINCRSSALTETYLNFQVRDVDEYVIIAPRSPGTCKGYILYPVKEVDSPSGMSDEDDGGNGGDDGEDVGIPLASKPAPTSSTVRQSSTNQARLVSSQSATAVNGSTANARVGASVSAVLQPTA